MSKDTNVSVVVNEFVLHNFVGIPSREADRLARWASAANYQFRTEAEYLILENPANQKRGIIERIPSPAGVKYYIKVMERGKLRKKSFTMEYQAYLMANVPLIDQIFPDNYKNIKIKCLES